MSSHFDASSISGNVARDAAYLSMNASDHHGKMDKGDQDHAKAFENEALAMGDKNTAAAVRDAAADGHWSKDDSKAVQAAFKKDQDAMQSQVQNLPSGSASGTGSAGATGSPLAGPASGTSGISSVDMNSASGGASSSPPLPPLPSGTGGAYGTQSSVTAGSPLAEPSAGAGGITPDGMTGAGGTSSSPPLPPLPSGTDGVAS